jgi:aspartate/methionine/tyrosine aminotransferase
LSVETGIPGNSRLNCSSRTEWNAPANRLMTIRDRKRREGISLIDLTETNPTAVGFQHDARSIRMAVSPPDILDYHPNPKGRMDAREAVSAYYRDHGRKVDPDNVILTASTSEAYAFLFKLLCDPGDEILVPRPSYPLFDSLAAWESVGIRPYPLRYSNETGWRIDLDRLFDAVTSRCRAIVTVNPNNPTGSYLSLDERETIEELCRRFRMAFLCDEVFLDFPSGESGASLVSDKGNVGIPTFTLSGLSKICGLPQLKLGWIAVSGPTRDVHGAVERLETIADTYLSVSTPVQTAAPFLLAGRRAFQEQVIARIHENETFLEKNIPPASVSRLFRREGGWMTILEVSRETSDEELACLLLEEDNVLVHPGYLYDMEETSVTMILSLITRPEVFRAGIRRVADRLFA